MPKTILVVDDVMSNRLIIKEMLRREYNVLEAESGEAALELLKLEYEVVSAVLLDVSMPGIGGFETLTRIRANKLYSEMPVIMITGSDNRETMIKSLALGANDFVMKPYSSEILKHCLGNNIAFREASVTVTALQRDKLTGLYVRESFFTKVREMVSAHEPSYYIMASFDIDKFKVINDQYGVQKGDEVLRHVANVFRDGFEPNGGICCRATADNFAVLYPSSFQGTDAIEAIRNNASHIEWLASPIIFSIGRYIVDDITMPPFAMYDRSTLAANSIKGRYDVKIAVYNELMREHLIREQEIVNEMEGALRAQQFEVWLQPQFNHSTDAMVGAEALVRWRHPQRGLIPPNEFIPVFEQNGFIYALDKFVWEETCRYLRGWINEGRSPIPLSVNISRYDMLCTDIIEVITGLVDKYGIPMDLLRLEITESAFASNTGEIISVVKKLINLGFTMEIDDFGSGYSSLNTLKDVPAQIIKLDMRFMESNDDTQRGGNIVESVVRMSKWLGMSVIAEGVETLEQADYLRSIGCNYMQGYYFAKPMPVDKYETFCRQARKEENLLTLETVDNLDNNAFWDPASIDTLIFNSYVGGACIYEFCNGRIELLRATEKYAQVLGSAGMTVEDALKLNWNEHLDADTYTRIVADIRESASTRGEITGEYVFLDLPGCPHETYLRSTMRVIASAGDRHLVYCTNENITAQRQSELRERLAAEQLSAIMQNINGGVTASVNKDGGFHILFANDVYYQQLGYTKEQYEELNGGRYICMLPEDVVRITELVSSMKAIGDSGSIEFRVRQRDGDIRWMSCNISNMKYPGEDKPVQLSVTTDITEQREAERTVKRLSEQMRAIMDNVDLGIIAAVVKGDSAEYLFANDRYYQMLGYTREQFEAEITSPYHTIAPRDRQMVFDETHSLGADVKSVVLVYSAVTRDGRERMLRAVISVGKLTGMDMPVQFTILRDVTDEIDTERRERLAMEQIKGMMDDMPGGFARMRMMPDGSIHTVYINDGLVKLMGMSHDELMDVYAKNALAGVHPDDVGIVKDVISRMLDRGEAHSSRYRLMHGGGEYIWLSIFGRVTKDADGDTYLNIYYINATDQVKDEEAQKALLDNLPGGAGIYELSGGRLSLTYQNKSYWELVGLHREAYPDNAPMSAIHPDDVPIIMQELQTAIEQKRDLICDIRLRHLTIGYRSVHLAGRIIEKEAGDYLIYATFTPNEHEGVAYQQMLPLVLSAIMESTTDLSFAKDASFRYLTCSRAFANLVGKVSQAEVIGKTDYELFAKPMADKFRSDDESLLYGGKPIIDMEESIPSDDGTPRYSSTSKYILRDGLGEIIGLYGVGRDITKTIVQGTQLKLVNDSVPGGLATYAVTDGAIRVVYCNDGYYKLLGGTREQLEALGELDPISWVLKQDRAELLRQINALANDGTPIDCIFRVSTIDGGYKWINEKAEEVERRDGTTLINTILIDITERQNSLELLRLSEEENVLAMKLAGSLVMKYIIADRSLHISPEIAAAHSLPTTITDVPYEPVRSGYISPESVDAYVSFFETILSGGDAGTLVYRQRYLGEWRWMEAKSSTLWSDSGKPVKAVISVHDVTEQIEKETVYKKWQNSLDERKPESYSLFRCNLNRNASYDSREGDLIAYGFDGEGLTFNERARGYAEQCVYEKDRQLYIDFVNADYMLASYYRGKRSGAIEYRELVPGGSARWLRLTVDLVEYPNSTDVEAYLMYEDIDEAKRAELQTKVLSQTDSLTGILNRATFAQSVDRLLSQPDAGARHALLMMDIDGFKHVNDAFGHGVGDDVLVDVARELSATMRPHDLLARLGGDEFVMFLKDVESDDAVIAAAKHMRDVARKVLSMEVRISASVGIAYAPADGTDFQTLYKKADAALYYVKGSGKDNQAAYSEGMADEHLSLEASAEGFAGASAPTKRRMLIVDDSSVDYEMLKRCFQSEYLIEKAADGQTALIHLKHYGSAISVVLLDLMMPDVDGFEVLEKLKADAELRSIPVIIVSGDESRETCLKAIRKGATDFVTKPVDQELIRLRVSSAVSKAENERLRTANSLLEAQNDERSRYEAALDCMGIAFTEYNMATGRFTYYSSMPKHLLGAYDGRDLWSILKVDMALDDSALNELRDMVLKVSEGDAHGHESATVKLKTPRGETHSFRVTAHRLVEQSELMDMVIIGFDDLEY